MLPTERPNGTLQWLPPELRRQIAVHCPLGSLAQLCLVDRIWDSECVPVLYTRVTFFFGHNQKTLYSSAACLRTLTTSTHKASLVRTLILNYPGRAKSLEWEAMELTKHLFSVDVFPNLFNLVDLRIRNGLPSAGLVRGYLNAALGRDDSPAQLRTLLIPSRYFDNLGRLGNVLTTQRSTLRMLGIELPNSDDDNQWCHSLAGHISEDCILFGFSSFACNRPFDRITVRKIGDLPAIFRLCDAEHAPRYEYWTYGFHIREVELRLGLDNAPTFDMMERLAGYFPHIDYLLLQTAHIPEGLETLVSPLKQLCTLVMIAAQGIEHDVQLDLSQRLALVAAIAAKGCRDLQVVIFPDNFKLRRSKDGISYDISDSPPFDYN